ncbi:unnamed protein product [Protopolystoma xenopodis]|uniref:Uncharacterized protein n=1 Tax=Protopolystoma xenopodis TaxID=117903 RepID=A0A448WRH6_9PLAT|nr:unnamed protein product [Protopolystoma xenopodis]
MVINSRIRGFFKLTFFPLALKQKSGRFAGCHARSEVCRLHHKPKSCPPNQLCSYPDECRNSSVPMALPKVCIYLADLDNRLKYLMAVHQDHSDRDGGNNSKRGGFPLNSFEHCHKAVFDCFLPTASSISKLEHYSIRNDNTSCDLVNQERSWPTWRETINSAKASKKNLGSLKFTK